MSIGYGLGLHLDSSNWDIPDWEKSLRKRLGWALFMQDQWSALVLGQPALILSSNWGVEPVSLDDFPELTEDDQEGSSEVQTGRVLFTHMISLTQILADLTETMFTVRAARRLRGAEGPGLVLEMAKPVQIRLKEWKARLPECLSMESTHIMKLSSVGT